MSRERTRVAQRLVEVREEKRLSQEQVAARAGVSVKTISRLENGHHDGRTGTLAQVATALGIQQDELLTGPAVEPDALEQILERLDTIAEQLQRIEEHVTTPTDALGHLERALPDLVPKLRQALEESPSPDGDRDRRRRA